MESIKLKIGRHEYEITEKDYFMDNGACVQLLTQGKEFRNYDYVIPVLSKRAIKEINRFPRIEKPTDYGKGVSVFKLNLKGY